MAYAEQRLRNILQEFLGTNAKIETKQGKMYIKFDEDVSFKELIDEEIEDGFYDDGYLEALNGKEFIIEIKEC
jgi:hypothetical protein